MWKPKRKQGEESGADLHQETEHNQENPHGIELHTKGKEEQWNTVKGKKTSEKATSPAKESSISPKTSSIQPSSNRFLSLSNLDGDSNTSAEDISSTTAMVLRETDATLNAIVIKGNAAISSQMKSDDPQKSLFSIHQLDKSLLYRVPNSSSSARRKQGHAGITIKEKPNPRNRST